jgi:hypothetical protein
VQRRRQIRRLGIDVGARCDQQRAHARVAKQGCVVQRRRAVGCGRVHVHTALQQHRTHVIMPALSTRDQRRPAQTRGAASVRVGTMREQKLYDRGLAMPRRRP